MMEVNDHEFDRAFRDKVLNNEPEFEETSWNRLEHKLNKRDRILLLRKVATIACILLMISTAGYHFINRIPGKEKPGIVQVDNPGTTKDNQTFAIPPVSTRVVQGNRERLMSKRANYETRPMVFQRRSVLPAPITERNTFSTDTVTARARHDQLLVQPNQHIVQGSVSTTGSTDITPVPTNAELHKPLDKANRQGRGLIASLALVAGPEFNSVTSFVGGKPGIAAGLLVSFNLNKKLSLQTGARYSKKEYSAGGYDYQFRNLRTKDIITGIDASCAVFEIPVLASYTVSNTQNRSIDLNAGVSSYLMLKEDYHFKYSPLSGISDRLSHFSNENQHFLSVIDLSATYYVKMKNDRVRFGFEPFLKVPLSGVGQGKINLKSNGVSLKLRYDLHK